MSKNENEKVKLSWEDELVILHGFPTKEEEEARKVFNEVFEKLLTTKTLK